MVEILLSVMLVALVAAGFCIWAQDGEVTRLRADLVLRAGHVCRTPSRTNFTDVGDFHEKFCLDSVTLFGAGPRNLAPNVVEFRYAFLHEELEEFDLAMRVGDQSKAFDALLDLVYVAMGTAHLMGFPWQAGWDRVQAANMAKERALSAEDPRSRRAHAKDVVKPVGWAAPDIEGLLASHGWPGPAQPR